MNIAVIGLGLIGGSFALAAKARGHRVCGVDTCAATLQLAKGQLDEVSSDMSVISNARMVFAAVPMGQYENIFAAAAKHLPPDAVLFDGASGKREVIRAAREKMGGKYARFVPSHPVAGDEKSGFGAARAGLFNGALAVVCPGDADDDAVESVRALWSDIGARVEMMDAESHDRVFAAVSHLPHLLSYALAGLIDKYEKGEKGEGGEKGEETNTGEKEKRVLLKYAAGGFRDFTRIAGSDSALWAEIFMSNADRLADSAREYQQLLGEFIALVEGGDGGELQKHLERARRLRLRYLAENQK
ncbi:MAG: prephenate dehydrogenase [Gammaproteobacteria bacterium]